MNPTPSPPYGTLESVSASPRTGPKTSALLAAGLNVTLYACEEDSRPEDSFDSTLEGMAEEVARIREASQGGDPWAWFMATVEVSDPQTGLFGRAYLGGCSYRSAADFMAEGPGQYWPDLLAEAGADLLAQVKTAQAKARKARTLAGRLGPLLAKTEA